MTVNQMTTDDNNSLGLIGLDDSEASASSSGNSTSSGRTKKTDIPAGVPGNVSKAWNDCKVPDFNDPDRPKTCLEVDFPIAKINALSALEASSGSTRKPIYQMSKWWARRQSSVFRSMLIAAATECPDDPTEAAKTVWEHYYCNHQKAKKYSHLMVLDPFMGGGTTLVEGARLGMQMTGIDLNPVAWFVCKNELAGSDPKQVEALFQEIEQEVKPQIQPYYITTCPRGHHGKWIDNRTNQPVKVDPATLPQEERVHYRWEGAEVIASFWAKHGTCKANGCRHLTPTFKDIIINEKVLTTNFLDITCPECGCQFHAELGESRMAPNADFLCTDSDEIPFTTTSQPFAQLLNQYDKGTTQDTIDRWTELNALVDQEEGLKCPHCHAFAGNSFKKVLSKHATCKATARKKKDFNIKKKQVHLWLLLSPDWLKGCSSFDQKGNEYGGFPDAQLEATISWNKRRLENLSLIEIRSNNKPDSFLWHDRIVSLLGSVKRKAHFTCAFCGKENNTLDSVRATEHPAPVALYSLQGYCPECEKEGYNYSGKFFKAPTQQDIDRINMAESEWARRSTTDLYSFYPREKCFDSYMMRANGGVNDGWGYTHWWKMFSSRQLLVHSLILKAITESSNRWPLDICEQSLGAFQQYLRNQNMFCIWDISSDQLTPSLSNANFHPKLRPVENCVFLQRGRGNFYAAFMPTLEGTTWAFHPSENVLIESNSKAKSISVLMDDSVLPQEQLICGSSSDSNTLNEQGLFDLVITDPPFGNNLFYADLADFFYVWLRIPMLKWYEGQPEAEYFRPERTPHSTEAVDNNVEHPDDREEYEKVSFIDKSNLKEIREITGDSSLEIMDANPLYRPEPSSDFYSQMLAACWSEAGRHLKPGGIMAFTFHHSQDTAWIDVLKALFDAGYYLVATYPIRSDETKGDKAAFGSKTIEYDIIHVCRKRLHEPEPASYAKMRKFVREEAGRLKTLLEAVHGKTLPEADLRVILRGKALEFYSQHYGQVQTGTGDMLNVRDALLGINQILDDILTDGATDNYLRPPESAEPISRLYLRIFKNVDATSRDALHKTLQGSGISQNDLESRGWISVVGRDVTVTPVQERYAQLTRRGFTRKHIKSDLDQCFFLMGMILAGKNLIQELENGNLKLKKSVPDILKWFSQTSDKERIHWAASTAITLMDQHEKERRAKQTATEQPSLFDLLDEEDWK